MFTAINLPSGPIDKFLSEILNLVTIVMKQRERKVLGMYYRYSGGGGGEETNQPTNLTL